MFSVEHEVKAIYLPKSNEIVLIHQSLLGPMLESRDRKLDTIDSRKWFRRNRKRPAMILGRWWELGV